MASTTTAKPSIKMPDAPGVGPTLAAAGIAVYAYDQRDHGKSPNAGLWAGRDAMVGDFKDFIALLRKTYPGVPVYAPRGKHGRRGRDPIAESVPGFVDGAILAAPAVWARSTMPITYRMALWVGVRIMPGSGPRGEASVIRRAITSRCCGTTAAIPCSSRKRASIPSTAFPT